MGKLYERDDIYDLLESESRDAITLKHYETVFGGKSIQTLLDVSIGTGSMTLPRANLGIRISDITKLRRRDIVQDGGRYHLQITEQKTGKKRIFTVPMVIAQYIENYCLRNNIGENDLLFPITTRAVQKQLAIVCDYLGYEGISTHSFRKWYATEIYKNSGYDITLVQRLLQHSSAATTQRYIGIEPRRIEQAIEGHSMLL